MTPTDQDLMKQASEKISQISGVEGSDCLLIEFLDGTMQVVDKREFRFSTYYDIHDKKNYYCEKVGPYLKIELGSKWDSRKIVRELEIEMFLSYKQITHNKGGWVWEMKHQKSTYDGFSDRYYDKWSDYIILDLTNPDAEEIANMLAIHAFWQSTDENKKKVEDYFKQLTGE